MLIQLSDLSLSRNGSDPILSHVDFHAEGGDFIYITGKVGTGKTSLLKVLYGELRPSEGKAEVLGQVVAAEDDVCRRAHRFRRGRGAWL